MLQAANVTLRRSREKRAHALHSQKKRAIAVGARLPELRPDGPAFAIARPLDVGPRGRTAVLLDGWTPEFARYLRARTRCTAHAAGCRCGSRSGVRPAAGWHREPVAEGAPPPQARGPRACAARCGSGSGRGTRGPAAGQPDRRPALAGARLRGAPEPEHTQLVVEQALLPHLQCIGALDGRRVTVLASALPMAEIEAGSMQPAARWPGDATLRDFRADPAAGARRGDRAGTRRVVVTPHAEVAQHLEPLAPQAVLRRLDWVLPGEAMPAVEPGLPLVVFAASALARKGARELAAALQGWPCRLRVLGSPSDDARLWQGIAHVEHMNWQGDGLAGASVVVLPAHIEHAPRALAARRGGRRARGGVDRVRPRRACTAHLVREVAPGDVDALRTALQAACNP
jgi:hypothetical protein